MARFVWAVLCERIITDAERNTVSYVETTDRLVARHLPAGLPRLFVATVWARDNEGETGRVRFRMKGPGESKATVLFETEDVELRWRHRINLNLRGAQIAGPGEYNILIDQYKGDRWKLEAAVPLLIVEDGEAHSDFSTHIIE